jgi:hypothetical protein
MLTMRLAMLGMLTSWICLLFWLAMLPIFAAWLCRLSWLAGWLTKIFMLSCWLAMKASYRATQIMQAS